jgi:sporulation protein YlmC with PRC-barrel domain
MKHISRYALTVASAALVCGTVAAQERTTQDPAPRASTPQQQVESRPAPGDKRATSLIGAEVKNKDGESVGEVEDLIVTGKDNLFSAVVTIGGVLGIGEKRVSIPYDDFEISPDGETVYLSMTEAELDALPEFDYDVAGASGSRAPNADANARTDPQAPRTEAQARSDTQPQAGARTANESGSASAAPSERTLRTNEQVARTLIGSEVVDMNNERVGKIRDLIIAPSGVQAVLLVGGPAFADGRMVVVPLRNLKIQPSSVPGAEPEQVQTQLSETQLAGLPEFHYN